MKKTYFSMIVLIIMIFISTNLFSQKEVVIKLKDGVSYIPIAIPVFTLKNDSEKNRKYRDIIHKTVWDDLRYSRVFQLIPQEHYSYIQKFDRS